MALSDSGIAAAVFLAAYTIFLSFMTYVVARKGFLTVYTFIFMFALFRFAGQLCGVVYAKLGYEHWQWLIAYLVLGAEGYFTLIFAAFRWTCRAQLENLGRLWILELKPKINFPVLKHITRSWRHIFHYMLIPANAMVIAGGSILSGINYDDLQAELGKVTLSKVLRTVGQAIFLSMTICLILLNVYVFQKEKIRNHVTIAVMLAAPFLLVRGIFGILSIYINDMNYYDLSNYNENGNVSGNLVIYEYVLSTTMEFVAALFLILKFWFDHRIPAQDEELSSDNEAEEAEKETSK